MRNHDEVRRQQETIPFFATFAAQREGLTLENHSEDNTQIMLHYAESASTETIVEKLNL